MSSRRDVLTALGIASAAALAAKPASAQVAQGVASGAAQPAASGAFWPNGARIAVSASLMLEAGGQNLQRSDALYGPMPDGFLDLPTNTWFEYGAVEGERRQMHGWRGAAEHRLELAAAFVERVFSQIAFAFAEQVPEHDRRGQLPREQVHPRSRRVQAKLQRLEVERAASRDDDLAVEDALCGQRLEKRRRDFGKVALEGLVIPALDRDRIPVAKDHGAKAVPLRLENPVVPVRQRIDALGQHGEHRRRNDEHVGEPTTGAWPDALVHRLRFTPTHSSIRSVSRRLARSEPCALHS